MQACDYPEGLRQARRIAAECRGPQTDFWSFVFSEASWLLSHPEGEPVPEPVDWTSPEMRQALRRMPRPAKVEPKGKTPLPLGTSEAPGR